MNFEEMIDRMDAVVNGYCTKFSHALQRATGLTCYFVARIGLGLLALSIISEIINYYFRFLPERTSILTMVLCAIILIACVSRSIAIQKGEDSIGRNVKPAELMRYMDGAGWRLLWIVFSIIDIFAFKPSHPVTSFIQDEAFALGCALFYNFIIVTPLPPGQNKVREWIKGLFSPPAELAKQENN